MSSNSEEIPDRCPVCNKGTRYLLIHINAKCYKSIDTDLIEKWKKLAKKRSKKKYQAKYVKLGKHKVAQLKYSKKLREEDEESFLKNQKLKQSRYLNKARFQIRKIGKRARKFRDLCRRSLYYLKQGEVPPEEFLMKFQLIEDELCRNYRSLRGRRLDPDIAHSWIEDFDFKLLQSMITFHEVALIPRSIWLKAQNSLSHDEDKSDLRVKLFKLIGKLQSYNHRNTKDVSIPEEFKSRCKATDESPWVWYPLPDDFSDEDQVLFIIFEFFI